MKKHNQLIFTGDFHSHIEGSALFLENLLEEKNQGNLLIDLGDFSEGNSFYDFSNGKTETKLVSYLYNLLVPGNHGFGEILELEKQGKIILCCNIYENETPKFTCQYIVELQGKKVLLIGVISPDAFNSIPSELRKNMAVKNPRIILDKIIDDYENQYDFVILLSHSGVEYDRKELASPQVNLIISSHCHSIGNIFDTSVMIRNVDEYGTSFGKIRVKVNDLEIEFVKFNRSDTFISKELSFLKDNLEQFKLTANERLGILPPDLLTVLPNREIFLQKLIARIIGDQDTPDIQVKLLNYTFLRVIDSDGSLSRKDLLDLIPFNTELYIICDKSSSYKKFSKAIPLEILECCQVECGSRRGEIHFVTSNYLYNNFYPKSREKIVKTINVRQYLTNLLIKD